MRPWRSWPVRQRAGLLLSVAVLSTAGGAGIAFTLDDVGNELGTRPGVSEPAGAHGGSGLGVGTLVSQAAGNASSPSPSGLPLPSLPTAAPPPAGALPS